MEFYLQRIMIFGVIVLGIIFAPFATVQLVDGNYVPFFAFVAFIALIGIVFGLRGQIWFLIPIAGGLGWTLNFLPLGFNMIELSCILTLGYMIIVVIVMEKSSIHMGPPLIWAPLVLLLLIICYHWLGSGGFRVFGGDTYGGRRNFQIVIGFIPYLIILTCAFGKLKYLNKVPFVFMVASLVGALPFIVSSFYPSTAGILYYFTGNVNIEAYMSATTLASGETDNLGRLGILGALGSAIQAWLICQYRPDEWWRPNRWWVAILSVICFFLCLRSGYRSTVFIFILVSLTSTFLWLRWKTLWICALGGTLVLILIFGQGELFNLPLSMQRSISFLPGNWDPEVMKTTDSSDDFRDRMKKIYWSEFGWQSPLLGAGFAVDPRVTQQAMQDQNGTGGMDNDDVIRGFILRRDFHEGLLSIWNGTGAVGLFLVVVLAFAFILLLYRHRKKLKPDVIQPIHVWVISFFIANYVGNFVVYGDMKYFYPGLCLYLAYLAASFGKEKTSEDRAKALTSEIRSEAGI